jgi:hypothetical protein
MAITVFLTISILLALFFFTTKRRLHLFEGIVLWAFFLNIHNNFIGFAGVDFHLIRISQRLPNFIAYCAIRNVIFPVFIMLFLEAVASLRRTWAKLACLVVAVHLLMGIVLLAERFNVLQHSPRWTVGWSYLSWTAALLLMYGLHQWIRRVLGKDVIV